MRDDAEREEREILEYLREGGVGEEGFEGLLIGHRITTHGQERRRATDSSQQIGRLS